MTGDLLYGGECPVCGRDFIDGFGPLEVGEQYEAEICITEKDAETGDGRMIVHLPGLSDE
jgi:hypothetical protein